METARADTLSFFRLSPEEQQLVAFKLAVPPLQTLLSDDLYLAADAKLQQLLQAPNRCDNPLDKFLTLRNFIRQVGALPGIWAQVHHFTKLEASYLELMVADHRQFLQACREAGFAVNSWMEKISRWVGHGHRFDSARALTEHRHDPQLHFVNDRANEEAFGPNYFFVHWDAQSVFAQRGSLLGRIAAGRTHAHRTATPQQVQEYLDRHLTAA